MRIYRDESSRFVPVTWYFVDRDNGALPYAHPFVSRVWERDENPPPLGEILDYHPYYRGHAPVPPGTGSFCGSETQWTRGALTTDHSPSIYSLGDSPCCNPSAWWPILRTGSKVIAIATLEVENVVCTATAPKREREPALVESVRSASSIFGVVARNQVFVESAKTAAKIPAEITGPQDIETTIETAAKIPAEITGPQNIETTIETASKIPVILTGPQDLDGQVKVASKPDCTIAFDPFTVDGLLVKTSSKVKPIVTIDPTPDPGDPVPVPFCEDPWPAVWQMALSTVINCPLLADGTIWEYDGEKWACINDVPLPEGGNMNQWFIIVRTPPGDEVGLYLWDTIEWRNVLKNCFPLEWAVDPITFPLVYCDEGFASWSAFWYPYEF